MYRKLGWVIDGIAMVIGGCYSVERLRLSGSTVIRASRPLFEEVEAIVLLSN